MHHLSKQWDDELITLTLPDYTNGEDAIQLKEVTRGSLNQPTGDRACDYCGLPLLADGIHIHAHCVKPERAELMEQVRLYRILVPVQ